MVSNIDFNLERWSSPFFSKTFDVFDPVEKHSSFKEACKTGLRKSKSGQRKLKAFLTTYRLREGIPEDLVEALSKYGKNPNGWTPLNYALEVGDIRSALALAGYLAKKDQDLREGGKTPVARLAQKINSQKGMSDEEELLTKLLIDKEYQTGFHYAELIRIIGLYGSEDIVRWVCAVREKPQLQNNLTDLVHGVLSSGRVEFLRILSEENIKIDISFALSSAARSGNVEIVKILWEDYQMRPELKEDVFGVTIHDSKSLEILKFLLEAGLDPNKPGSKGKTALAYALSLPVNTDVERAYKQDVIRTLLEYNAQF